MIALPGPAALAPAIGRSLVERNDVSRRFFAGQSSRLATVCAQMAERFARGGRLLAIGRCHYSTDAQHVSVEFVHPVIVGKRALPAMDLSALPEEGVLTIVRPEDMVMGFADREGDPEIGQILSAARRRGALTFGLSEQAAEFAAEPPTDDPFVHQELIEILYHTLWETVHVFLEHRAAGHDVGPAGFLYPYLGRERQDTTAIRDDVAASIESKAAADERLREQIAERQSETIAGAATAIRERVAAGGTVIAFGNGGSATDANDLVFDCVAPLKRYPAIRAISLSMEPACISAIANDVGRDAIFLRQLIAHGRSGDVAVAISTSGGSSNVIAALEDARRRGLFTLALLGYDGGEIVRRGLADLSIVVPCDYIPRIQEIQASIYHVLLDAIHRKNVE